MRNAISQIENAVDMNQVEEIMSEFYSYAFVQGQLSMVEVDAGREGLQPLPEVVDKDTKVEVLGVGSKATGFKSPKHKWSPELDELIVGSAVNGLDLQKLSQASTQGFTYAAMRSRLYRLGYRFKVSKGWFKKEVA